MFVTCSFITHMITCTGYLTQHSTDFSDEWVSMRCLIQRFNNNLIHKMRLQQRETGELLAAVTCEVEVFVSSRQHLPQSCMWRVGGLLDIQPFHQSGSEERLWRKSRPVTQEQQQSAIQEWSVVHEGLHQPNRVVCFYWGTYRTHEA